MLREIVTETSRDKSSGRVKKLSGKGEAQACRIQVETCPAPECNLSAKDVRLFLSESKKYMKLFRPAFARVEQIKKSLTYLHGLLGNAPRKNVEQMALGQKEKVRSLQYFVGQSQWETEPVIAIHQGLIGKTLGEADGVMNGLKKDMPSNDKLVAYRKIWLSKRSRKSGWNCWKTPSNALICRFPG